MEMCVGKHKNKKSRARVSPYQYHRSGDVTHVLGKILMDCTAVVKTNLLQDLVNKHPGIGIAFSDRAPAPVDMSQVLVL